MRSLKRYGSLGSDYGSLGNVDGSLWDTSRYPGVAKPLTTESLGIFKDLQLQTNRLGSKYGIKAISVDGDLGPASLAAVLAVAKASKLDTSTAWPLLMFKDINQLAAEADVVASQFRGAANGLGAPASVPAPVQTAPLPTLVPGLPPGGQQAYVPPSQFEMLTAGIPGGTTGALIIAGGILLLIAQKKGMFKKKGKGARAMARARRRR